MKFSCLSEHPIICNLYRKLNCQNMDIFVKNDVPQTTLSKNVSLNYFDEKKISSTAAVTYEWPLLIGDLNACQILVRRKCQTVSVSCCEIIHLLYYTMIRGGQATRAFVYFLQNSTHWNEHSSKVKIKYLALVQYPVIKHI